MIYVFYGPDQFRAREALNELRAQLDTNGDLTHNTTRLEGRGVTSAELRAAGHTASFFAENRLVIVEGLMARFSGSRRRSASGRARKPSETPSDFDAFADVLNELPETTTVVLIDEQSSTAFLDALGKNAQVTQFPILRGNDVRQWASERARTQGAQLAPGALDRLVLLIDGTHLGELAQEIDKLVTYAGGRQIDVSDIDELVSGAVQHQTWDLTDAVIEGRVERALSVLRAMDEREFAPQLLIFMLTRQFRQLLLAQALLREGLNQDQIGTQLSLTGYPLKKIVEQSTRYPAERLEAAYRRLLETDVAVKTGVLDVSVALELLVADLAELARRPRTAARR